MKLTITSKASSIIIWLCFIVTIITIFSLFNLMNVGLDLTDEGYYLNWINNPWIYKYYVSQFGYIYHPIYKALGNSIVHLRQANMLISFGLSWLLSYFVLKQMLVNTSKIVLIVAGGSLALPALYILMTTGNWLPTPSYNSLNFQGCLTTLLGIVLSVNQNKNHQKLSGFLIGLGGWLVFMAKPSTALLLAVVAVIYYLPTIKKDWRILLIAGLVAIALLLLTAFAIDGSVLQFIRRYQGGLLLLNTMQSIHGLDGLFRLDFFSLSATFKSKLLVATLLIFFGLKLVNSKYTVVNTIAFSFLFAIITFTPSLIFIQTDVLEKVKNYQPLITIAITFACVLFYLFRSDRKKSIVDYRKFFLFFVLPYIFAVGTGNNYWLTAISASFFWVLAGLFIIPRVLLSIQMLSVILVSVLAVGLICINNSLQIPYRQNQTLLKQTSSYIDPLSNDDLILPTDTAKYLNTLNKVLVKTSFDSQTPVIDLTGHHPGTLYFMQAKAIGQAWTIGGYKGSHQLAALALSQAGCEDIAQAWLLLEVDGKRKINSNILENLGLKDIPSSYQNVIGFKTQILTDFSSIDDKHPDGRYIHYLLKPINAKKQTQACLAYRKVHPSPFESL